MVSHPEYKQKWVKVDYCPLKTPLSPFDATTLSSIVKKKGAWGLVVNISIKTLLLKKGLQERVQNVKALSAHSYDGSKCLLFIIFVTHTVHTQMHTHCHFSIS